MKGRVLASGAEAQVIRGRLAEEIAGFDASTRAGSMTLAEFRARLVPRHRPVTVTFAGGVTRTCWTVARSDGCYSVLYLPGDDLFTLCMDSDFGPLDIGVHGRALDCFGSV